MYSDVFVAVCKKGCYNRCNMVNLCIATTFWCGNLQISAVSICFLGRFSYFCDMKNGDYIPAQHKISIYICHYLFNAGAVRDVLKYTRRNTGWRETQKR